MDFKQLYCQCKDHIIPEICILDDELHIFLCEFKNFDTRLVCVGHFRATLREGMRIQKSNMAICRSKLICGNGRLESGK